MFTFGCYVPVNTTEENSQISNSQADNNETPFRFGFSPASLPSVNDSRFCMQSTHQTETNEPNLHTPRYTSPTADLTRTYQSPIFGATLENKNMSEKMSQKKVLKRKPSKNILIGMLRKIVH